MPYDETHFRIREDRNEDYVLLAAAGLQVFAFISAYWSGQHSGIVRSSVALPAGVSSMVCAATFLSILTTGLILYRWHRYGRAILHCLQRPLLPGETHHVLLETHGTATPETAGMTVKLRGKRRRFGILTSDIYTIEARLTTNLDAQWAPAGALVFVFDIPADAQDKTLEWVLNIHHMQWGPKFTATFKNIPIRALAELERVEHNPAIPRQPAPASSI